MHLNTSFTMKSYSHKFLYILVIIGFISSSAFGQKGQVVVNQSAEIDELIRLKKEINRTEKQFEIQIFSGPRSGAEKARTEFRESFYGWPVSMSYETPNYKIRVGDFNTQLEADRALLDVKKKFRSAFILKPNKKKN